MRPVRVIILKDVRIPVTDKPMDLRKGSEVELPRWVAEVLVEDGVAKFKDVIDLNYINAYHYKEKRTASTSQLSQLPPDFYVKVKEYIKSLEESLRSSPNFMLLNDREVSEKNLLEISQIRLGKIIRLAQTEVQEDVTPLLTPEETLVYSLVREVVESWRSYIQSLVGGEGK